MTSLGLQVLQPMLLLEVNVVRKFVLLQELLLKVLQVIIFGILLPIGLCFLIASLLLRPPSSLACSWNF